MTSMQTKPSHSGCLTAWLGLSAIVSILGGIALFALLPQAALVGKTGLIYLLLGGIVLNLVFLYGIMNWKRWGVYGIAAISVISSIVQIVAGIATARDYISPFVQLGLLYYLIRDKWDYFD